MIMHPANLLDFQKQLLVDAILADFAHLAGSGLGEPYR
jgi:hypothetical protein